MKRKYVCSLFMMLLLCLGFSASAVKVTFEWNIPGSVELRLNDPSAEPVKLSANQTSYTWESESSYGYVYAFATDGYRIVDGKSTDESKSFNPGGTPPRLSMGFYSSDEGKTVKITTAKLERDDQFQIDVVNGLANIISAEFKSGYTLDLEKGDHTYKFSEEFDNPLTIFLDAVTEAYSITLNGKDLAKNNWYPRYDDIEIKSGDKLKIQVFENDADEPSKSDFKIEYGPGMDGCIENIRSMASGVWYYPKDFSSGSLSLLENTELTVNFVKDDYTITKVYLNGKDISSSILTSSFNGAQSIEVTVSGSECVFRVEGTKKEYGNIDFTGYIINAQGVDFSLSYGGTPFDIPEGEDVTSDIVVTSSLTMPASETKKYIIPISEKIGKFFFSPKDGYYITDVYTLTPEGIIEQHSGNSSMTATIDGTTFYMVVEKLPESYTANLNVIGSDFTLRIQSGTTASSTWGNNGSTSYSSEPGEREISFVPGVGTPITFGFTGDENQQPVVYLDGAEVTGVENSDSNALEFFVTPYSPSAGDNVPEGRHSDIVVYNSFNQRPQMSGASLELVDGAQAAFYYSPVYHQANRAGQPVISGTQFIVKPASTDMTVIYKDEIVALNDRGEFVFIATGNARNNVVKVVSAEGMKTAWELLPEPDSTVESLDELIISFPEAETVEFVGETYSFVLRSGGYFAVPGMNCEKIEDAEVPSFRISLPEGVVTPVGDYLLIIEEGTFKVDGLPSSEIRANYLLDRESPTDYQVSPDKTIVYQDYGYDFALVFDPSTTVGWTLDYDKFHLSFNDADLTPNSDYSIFSETNMLMFQVTNKDYIKEGHLKLEIEADAFKLGSTPSPAISAEWDVVAPREYVVEVSAKSEADENGYVNDLSEIYLLFPDAKSGEVFMESGAFLRSSDYSYSQTGEITLDETNESGVKVVLSFSPAPETMGSYILSVHTGAVTLDETFESPGVDETFLFDKNSGAASIFADENGCVSVFSIDGKAVIINSSPEQIRLLENGIYVINGKKTIVK